MKIYDFDTIIERKNTYSIKYDSYQQQNQLKNVIPLWVADMDFKTAPEIIEDLVERAKHGIYGYTEILDPYYTAVVHWMQYRHNWEIKKEWVVVTPGVVSAISSAIRSLTKEGDSILIQPPVYHPFSDMILKNKRKLVTNPLQYKEGHYEIDFKDFEKKVIENDVKIFILCNPHNPVGRVWTKEELIRLGDICLQHGVVVISDEIHNDFIYKGYQHHVFASLKEEYKKMTITCTSPSKTFNLAGLQISNIIMAHLEYKEKIQKDIQALGQGHANTFGLEACISAYTKGERWLEELLSYLEDNIAYVRSFLSERLPMVKLVEPEGLYLLWIDFRNLGLSNTELDTIIQEKAKLWLSPGHTFGTEGSGFQRMNIACPRSVLKKALLQLETIKEYL